MLLPAASRAVMRVVDSARVIPNFQGGIAVCGSLVTMGAIAAGGIALGWLSDNIVRPTAGEWPTASLVARVLVVPSLVEEVVWRVVLQPPAMAWSTRILINGVFAWPYHWIGGTIAAKRLGSESGAATAFHDPMFIAMAFLLGNLCSVAYHQSGYGLWAPVVVHGVTVSIWLSVLGGEAILLHD